MPLKVQLNPEVIVHVVIYAFDLHARRDILAAQRSAESVWHRGSWGGLKTETEQRTATVQPLVCGKRKSKQGR